MVLGLEAPSQDNKGPSLALQIGRGTPRGYDPATERLVRTVETLDWVTCGRIFVRRNRWLYRCFTTSKSQGEEAKDAEPVFLGGMAGLSGFSTLRAWGSARSSLIGLA
ncbi:hypothetical protein FEAC_21810 [Ferrimicrobium acidiphilum DSM 19497]|uniref:Uncharacterized protein n=2 Tax=Ferrimicrobium acidiphilum TaxID=121039 RepID=A0A0D8FS40_9ACTN|nr:hypothetical protein FEAC_21810 [Ferrimicrobium acidiphilum DSM 19497]